MVASFMRHRRLVVDLSSLYGRCDNLRNLQFRINPSLRSMYHSIATMK